MTTDNELSRTVRTFLEEGMDRLPDRVFQSVMDGVESAPQRRRLRLPWRFDTLNSSIKPLLVLLPVVLIALAGAYLLIPGGAVQPVPSPSPTAAPTATPTPTAIPSPTPIAISDPGPIAISDPGPMAPGSYRAAEPFPVPFQVTVPSGWNVNGITGGETTLVANGGASVGAFILEQVIADPCHYGSFETPQTTPTADDLVTAFGSMVDFDATAPVDTTLGGLPARQFRLSNDIDTDSAACTDGALLPLFVDVTSKPASTNGGLEQQLWVVDHPSGPVLIVAETGDDPEAGQAAIDEVLADLSFE